MKERKRQKAAAGLLAKPWRVILKKFEIRYRNQRKISVQNKVQYLNYHPDVELARRILEFYPGTPRLYLHSFGCQQNVNDGELLHG